MFRFVLHPPGDLQSLLGQGVQALAGQVDVHGGEAVGQGGDHHVQGHHNGHEEHGHQGGHAAPLHLIEIERLFGGLLLFFLF